MDSNFAALWSTDFIFPVLKDLNLLKKFTKNQEANYSFRLIFACQIDLIYIGLFSNRM